MHWTVYLEGGPRRVNHAAAAVGNLIYSFGGYCSSNVQQFSTPFEPIDVHIFNTSKFNALKFYYYCSLAVNALFLHQFLDCWVQTLWVTKSSYYWWYGPNNNTCFSEIVSDFGEQS